MDPIEFIKSNSGQVMVDDNGAVRLAYVENLPFINKQDLIDNTLDEEESDSEIEVV